MKVTLLGHACFLIETENTAVITDPIFWENFEQKGSVSFPKREINLDELPKIDGIYLSHFHSDHFDLESLQRIGKDVPLYVPADRDYLIFLKLKKFSKIHITQSFKELRVGDIRIIPTPSATPKHLEYGAVFFDGTNSFWTQVDTVVTEEVCSRVKEVLGGEIDLVACPHQLPMDYVSNWPNECFFPDERYERMLKMASKSNARIIATGSYGIKIKESKNYYNYGLFPVKTSDFIRDLKDLAPNQDIKNLRPGEGFKLNGIKREYFQNENLVRLVEENVDYEFNPKYFKSFVEEKDVNAQYEKDNIQFKCEEFIEQRVLSIKERNSKDLIKNLLNQKYKVCLDIFYGGEKSRWNILKDGEVHFSPSNSESDDWDYRYSYKASDILKYLNNETKIIPYLAYRNAKKSGLKEPIELMGFDPRVIIDGNDPWHPLELPSVWRTYM